MPLSSQMYFPSWIYDKLKGGPDLDWGPATENEKKIAKKIVMIALWCIQVNPINPPLMRKVLELLEGDVELVLMPPKPVLAHENLFINGEADKNPVARANSSLLEAMMWHLACKLEFRSSTMDAVQTAATVMFVIPSKPHRILILILSLYVAVDSLEDTIGFLTKTALWKAQAMQLVVVENG
ncbi:hypothetical protein RJ641_033736 [Dillenia turbinata]|uniref:Uncharacterized protein n=1 Tax=Dillenia turbinata TaxID=194707 RepID=A0AAN8ZG21_9MAGN